MSDSTTPPAPPDTSAVDGSESWWDRPVNKANGSLLLNILSLFISALAIGINIGMLLCRR